MTVAQDALDGMNLGGAAADVLPGIEYGVKLGSSLAGAVGTAFGPFAPLFAAAGAYYGAILGAAGGFLAGLFTPDHAAQQRRATAVWRTKINARAWIDDVFSVAPADARAALVASGLYQTLLDASDLARFVDPLAALPPGPASDQLRERIRVASITKDNPQGTILGDPALVAQVKDRLASAPADPVTVAVLGKIAQDAAAGRPVDPADLASIVAAQDAATKGPSALVTVATVAVSMVVPFGVASLWKLWKKRHEERSAE